MAREDLEERRSRREAIAQRVKERPGAFAVGALLVIGMGGLLGRAVWRLVRRARGADVPPKETARAPVERPPETPPVTGS